MPENETVKLVTAEDEILITRPLRVKIDYYSLIGRYYPITVAEDDLVTASPMFVDPRDWEHVKGEIDKMVAFYNDEKTKETDNAGK